MYYMAEIRETPLDFTLFVLSRVLTGYSQNVDSFFFFVGIPRIDGKISPAAGRRCWNSVSQLDLEFASVKIYAAAHNVHSC